MHAVLFFQKSEMAHLHIFCYTYSIMTFQTPSSKTPMHETLLLQLRSFKDLLETMVSRNNSDAMQKALLFFKGALEHPHSIAHQEISPFSSPSEDRSAALQLSIHEKINHQQIISDAFLKHAFNLLNSKQILFHEAGQSRHKIISKCTHELLLMGLEHYANPSLIITEPHLGNSNLIGKQTLLGQACLSGWTDCITVLLKHKADVNEPLSFYGNALYQMTAYGHTEEKKKQGLMICSMLLDAGADLDIKSSGGETIYDQLSARSNSNPIKNQYREALLALVEQTALRRHTQKHGTSIGIPLNDPQNIHPGQSIEQGPQENSEKPTDRSLRL